MVKADKDKAKTEGAKVTINEKWCKRCGICVVFCPKEVFVTGEFGLPIAKYPEKCIKCMLCVMRCPEFAIDVKDIEEKEKKNKGE